MADTTGLGSLIRSHARRLLNGARLRHANARRALGGLAAHAATRLAWARRKLQARLGPLCSRASAARRGAAAALQGAAAALRGAAARAVAPPVGGLRSFAARLTRVRRRKRQRPSSLVRHILSLQLVIIAAVGILALASLSWTSQTIIENNLSHWAAQWTSQLNELGAPFYLSDEGAALLSVERFVATYPEVAHVNWYDADGAPLFSVAQEGRTQLDPMRLGPRMTARLTAAAGTDSPHVLDDDFDARGRFRLIGPIWTESIVSDGLMDFDAGAAAETTLEVLGFVSVDLDFSWYHEQLISKLALGSLFLLSVLALSWAAVRRVLKNALLPLSRLQQPLAELAKGNMKAEFVPSRHAEIQNIVTTLEETAAALEQRDRHLYHLATHDPLTGLYNRHQFVEELEAEIQRLEGSTTGSAVFFIDLDQFKYINDTCGHPAGDELLRLAARCISGATRADDIVSRFGGDEFTVLARDVTRRQARTIGLKILDQMRMLTQVQDNKVFHLQCSVGVAMVQPGQLGPHERLAQADIACHAAKSKGRNRLEVYKVSARENQEMAKEIRWVQTVRQALEHGSFVLTYQPLVHVSTGVADHYEVLLRLETEKGRLIPPDAFLPAATRFGLIVDIDHWVVEHALQALAAFRVERPDLRFSINLSAHAFDDERFAERVKALLSANQLPAEAVVFEITEQVAVRFAAQVDKQLMVLRELGCRFAIDDFGKGYSSFSYLKQLPVDYLKIDGSFIEQLDRDPMDQTLVRVLGEIAQAAGLETVAECVQNAAALDLLAQFGIDYAQGFYLGRPARFPEDKQFLVPGSRSRPRAARRA